MKKKIFTMGKVYDLGTLGVNEIENAVQADLDKVFNASGVKFQMREVSGKTLELTFLRKYRATLYTQVLSDKLIQFKLCIKSIQSILKGNISWNGLALVCTPCS